MSSIKQEFKSGTTGSYNGIDPLQVLSSDMHEVSVDPIKVEYMSDCEENPPVYFNEVMIKDEQQKNDTTMKDEYVTENEELQMKFEEFPEDSAVECTRDRENISIASSGDTNSSWSSNYKIQTTKTSADEHLHEHPNLHNNLNRETKAKTQHSPYSCDICKRTFKKLDKFKKHVRFHEQHNQTSERSFICSVCDKSFAKRFNLTVHLRTHTKERPYVCSICNKSFVQRQHLTAHQRKFRNLEEFEKHVHFKEKKQQTGEHNQTNERSFICSVCDKSFAKRFNLIVHLRTHTSERPHTCSICNRSFVQRQHLTAHQSTHTNERPYSCSFCNKSYTQNRTLKLHLRIHTNERPHTCNICNKSFTYRSSLKVHNRIHTNVFFLHNCNICDKSFTEQATLKRHMRSHTK